MKTAWRSLRRAIRLNRDERMMFYNLWSAQLRAGIVPATACRTLSRLPGLPSGVTHVAHQGAQAAREGRPEVEGLADTGLIPVDELALLRIGQRTGQLRETLDELVASRDADQGFLGQVVAPNTYLLVVISVLTAFVMLSEGYFANLNVFNEAANPLFDLSQALQVWLPPALVGAAAAIGLGIWGAHQWTGSGRRLLVGFDPMVRLQFGIRFAQLAERLSRRGVPARGILEVVAEVWPDSRYLTHHARRALQAIQAGELWETALGRGLLSPQHASLLRGLVPGSAMALYPAGYRGLIDIQRQILAQRLRRMRTFGRGGLLGIILWLFFQLVQGLYTLVDTGNLTGGTF